MQTLLDYFPHIFYINLARRPDRNEKVMQEFEKIGIAHAVQRIEAFDHQTCSSIGIIAQNLKVSPGNIACAWSHLKVVYHCIANNIPKYLVFEDDAEPCENFNETFVEYYKQVPDDWELLYLGANHDGGVIPYSGNVVKPIRSYTTHAFAAKQSMYASLKTVWESQDAEIDVCLSRLQTIHNSFCFRPNLVYQSAGFSDILNKHDDYKFLREK